MALPKSAESKADVDQARVRFRQKLTLLLMPLMLACLYNLFAALNNQLKCDISQSKKTEDI